MTRQRGDSQVAPDPSDDGGGTGPEPAPGPVPPNLQPQPGFSTGELIGNLEFAIGALDSYAGQLGLDDAAWVLADARKAYSDLKVMLDTLENRVGDLMGDKAKVDVDHVGHLERHRHKSYTQWDREALLRDVLDSRLVDKNTGEVLNETPLEKVLAVWNLGAPRKTVLLQRGLQPDEYAFVDDKGVWKIELR